MLMSKSQAQQAAAMLRQAAKSSEEGLVRISYIPGRGIVVLIVKRGCTVLTVGETGAPILDGYHEVIA